MNLQAKLKNPNEVEKIIKLLLFGAKYNLQIEDITPEAIGAVPDSRLPEPPETGNFQLVSTDGVVSWEEIV